MELESVRALKAELSQTVIRPFVLEARGVRALALTTRSTSVLTTSVLTHVRPGIALGVARGGGKKDFRLAVRIQRRVLESDEALTSRIRESAKGEVDFRYVGRISKSQTGARPWQQSRHRPLQIGSSIGHYAVTAGTLGCFVTHAKIKGVGVLSNNHVLANENDAKRGDAIVQPGRLDGGKRPRDKVASLAIFQRLRTGAHNRLDAAIAAVNRNLDFDPETVEDFGRVKAYDPAPVEPGLKVVKLGRTTGFTRGEVTAIEVDDVIVNYDSGDFTFDGQFEIESEQEGPFSLGGDSGSLIMDAEGHARGLLFAGSDVGGKTARD
jgi:Peptidase family S64